ncbi:hypothetical protein [Halorubrum sp. BOL3-1]|nr:hypothetical protein [Halorubrum sp. BOL3-1]
MTIDRFPAALDALPDPVVIVDVDGVVRAGTPAWSPCSDTPATT